MSIKTDKKTILLAITTTFMFSMLLSAVTINAQFQPTNTDTNDKKQIFIDKNDIKSYESKSTLPQKYSDYYNATFLFDKLVNSFSYLSVKGNDAGFNVELKQPLKNSICSVQAIVLYPQLGTSYLFTLTNASGSLTDAGILSSSNQEIKMQDCIDNVTNINMKFNPTNPTYYTVLSELNLYTEKDVVNPPPLECPEGSHAEGDKCVPDVTPPPNGNQTITNSTVTIDISKSDIKILANDSNIYFPNMTLPYPNMTIPDIDPLPVPNVTDVQSQIKANEIVSDPNDKSDEKEEEDEREEQEDKEEEEDDDN